MPLNDIKSIAHQIADRRIPVKALAESLGIGTTTLHRWFNDVGIKLVTSPGRPPNPDILLIRQRVHYSRYTLGIWAGYKHAAESIALPGEPPPYHVVYEILRPVEPQPEKPVRQHDHRFVA
jgi:hypothetical protein